MSEQNRQVILAFSGGIDSTEAIKKLQKQGYDIIALFFSLLDGDDTTNVTKAANELGVKLEIIDLRERFKREIIDNFTSEYLVGRTPAPCTRCNPLIKWYALNEYSKQHNIKYIATGHYFKVTKYQGKYYVTRPLDPRKDQTYYLWGLSQEILSKIVTPMADIIKSDLIQRSQNKRESMGICFLKGLHYTEYITTTCGTQPTGDIITPTGEVVGHHCGVANYTIGQKRGEGIPAGCYVTKINTSNKNTITVAPRAELYAHKLFVNQCNVVDKEILLNTHNIKIMVRGIGINPDGYTHFTPHMDGYIINLDNPAYACAPGQPVVFYHEDRVIGGGYLQETL